ncbi:hypothetical protein ACJX0J_042041, partial [Zea mays]
MRIENNNKAYLELVKMGDLKWIFGESELIVNKLKRKKNTSELIRAHIFTFKGFSVDVDGFFSTRKTLNGIENKTLCEVNLLGITVHVFTNMQQNYPGGQTIHPQENYYYNALHALEQTIYMVKLATLHKMIPILIHVDMDNMIKKTGKFILAYHWNG